MKCGNRYSTVEIFVETRRGDYTIRGLHKQIAATPLGRKIALELMERMLNENDDRDVVPDTHGRRTPDGS